MIFNKVALLMALCFDVDVMKEEKSVRAAGKRDRVLTVVYNPPECDGVCGVAI